jgi:hypothetical protein
MLSIALDGSALVDYAPTAETERMGSPYAQPDRTRKSLNTWLWLLKTPKAMKNLEFWDSPP